MRRILAVTMLVLSPSSALAQAPQLLSYQGRLLRADGSPRTGFADITFAIYAAEAPTQAEKAIWSELQRVVLTNGFYAVFLGAGRSVTEPSQPAPPFPVDLFDGSPRWLELTVAGDPAPLTPRQKIVSVAYALRTAKAASADRATNADHAARATDADHADRATNADHADRATNADHADGASAASGALASQLAALEARPSYEMQAGRALKNAATVTIPFPRAFSNGKIPVVVVTPNWGGGISYVERNTSVTNTGFTVASSNAASDYYVYWIAFAQ